MKDLFKFFGIITLTVIIGFSMLACDPDKNDNTATKPLFSVSGEFKGAESGNVLFTAATAETVSRSARSAASTYDLTGELEDGGMLFRLKGTYDSSTGSYTVSSASSFARYTVNGNESGATATLAVLQNGEWQSFIVSVTTKEVSVKSGNVQDYEGGLPAWAKGSWHDWWSENAGNYNHNSMEAWAYFDQWYYEGYKSSVWRDNWDFTATKYTVISAEDVGNGVYDVIFSYPLYRATDDLKIAALKKFFSDIKLSAGFWNKRFNPWDRDVWDCDQWDNPGDNTGKNYDNSVIWYFCDFYEKGLNHGGLKIINWDTFEKLLTEEQRGENGIWSQIPWEGTYEQKKDTVATYFAGNNIKNYYYYGWHDDNRVNNPEQGDRTGYICWEPVCEDVGNQGKWWDETRYYVKWGNQTGIMGDWDKYREMFNKWTSDDYLVTYLRSQNVQPETWYTRVRIRIENNDYVFQYYNGDNEAQQDNHSAPPCDTKSLTKIKELTFDPDYYGWSYFWTSQRTTPR